MSFYIDAFLEHPEPELFIREQGSNRIIAYFNQEALCTFFPEGCDRLMALQDPSPETQQQLIQELLLAYCKQAFYSDLDQLAQQTQRNRQAQRASRYTVVSLEEYKQHKQHRAPVGDKKFKTFTQKTLQA